jgi:uncharacterized protein YceK
MSRRRLIVALTVLTVAGCGSVPATTAPTTGRAPQAVASLPASPCPTKVDATTRFPDVPGLEHLPADVVPTTLIECDVVSRTFAGEGVWSVTQERQATSSIDAVVAAMRLPSEPVPLNQACPAILILVPWFGFFDAAGHWVRADVPRDSCGQPQAAVRNALQALTFTTISETRLKQEQTPEQVRLADEATALGCDPTWKDVIGSLAGDPAANDPAAGSPLDDAAVPTVLCRLRTSAGLPYGNDLEFVSGTRLSPALGAQLAHALGASRPVRPCTVEHSAVALLKTAADGWALIEVDGCHRTYGSSNRWGQATPDLLSALV